MTVMAEPEDPDDGIPHGTYNGYSNYRCRCQPCRDAGAEYARKRKATLRAKAAADPSVLPHGTVRGYIDWDCRCAKCRGAYATYRYGRRSGGNSS